MSSNIIGPLPNKSDAPSEKVEKSSGDLYYIKNPVVNNIETVDKKGKSIKMWLRKPTHLLYHQKIILTQSTKQINNKHPKKQSISPRIIKLTHITQ